MAAYSVTLKNIILKTFPEEYAERKLEHESLTKFGVDLMPLFVMDVVLPCQKFPLHIFEPRYRLMVSCSGIYIAAVLDIIGLQGRVYLFISVLV